MDQDLRKRLAELHDKLESSPEVDAESKRLLEALTEDIDRLLDPDDQDPESIGDRLADGVRRFEESHPDLAVALGRIADALSHLGI